MRTFEDFTPGASAVYGPITVTKEDIVSFARAFDPQPFHVDEEAAKGTFVGRLIASGWHTCAINMRLIAEGFLLDAASLGAPGIEEVKWLRPVLPGDTLRSRATVLETKESRSRPDLGLVRFRFDVVNDADAVVLEQTNWIMFGRRGAGPREGRPPDRPPGPQASGEAPVTADGGYLEDLVIGEAVALGSFHFTAEDIKDYARRFDPQPFHMDEEAARRSLFGGLCASGWHTAAVWMKLMIGHRTRLRERLEAQNRPVPRLGPSPGFRNLSWAKPVFAGDTLTFRSTITGTRASATRPGWGLAFHRNSAVNQAGEEVFGFDGAVFWERRP